MRAVAEPENWRRKYFDAVTRLEQEEGQWKALEGTLRRFVNRLCVAAEGQDPALDRQLGRLGDFMRRRVPGAELDQLFEPLSKAIAALDAANRNKAAPPAAATAAPLPTRAAPATSRLFAPLAAMATALRETTGNRLTAVTDRIDPGTPAAEAVAAPVTEALLEAAPAAPAPGYLEAPPPAEAIFGDDRVRATLARLLDELRQDANLVNDVVQIEVQLETSLTREQLPPVLGGVAELVARRIRGLQREKREVEELLCQVTSRLDEFTTYIAGTDTDRKLALESTRELNSRVLGEMRDLGADIGALDVHQVQQVVRTRLEAINAHLLEHRSREEQRANTHWERSEKMRQRVERLEQEARDLHDKLRDEQRLALVDSLTQIPNRLAYDQRIEEEIKRFRRFGNPVCIAAIDIDRFKGINDAYGHKAGDKVLRVVADTFAERIRETDFMARYGGEEFVALLTGVSLQDAQRVMDELRLAVERLGFHFRGNPVSVTISIGVTLIANGDTGDDAFERADQALYQAKQTGRNRCIAA